MRAQLFRKDEKRCKQDLPEGSVNVEGAHYSVTLLTDLKELFLYTDCVVSAVTIVLPLLPLVLGRGGSKGYARAGEWVKVRGRQGEGVGKGSQGQGEWV